MFFYAFFIFLWKLSFWVKNAFFSISESKILKESKILLKGHFIGLSPVNVFDYSKYI